MLLKHPKTLVVSQAFQDPELNFSLVGVFGEENYNFIKNVTKDVKLDPEILMLAALGDQTAYDSIVGPMYKAERNKWVYSRFFHVNVYFRETIVSKQEQVPSVSLSDLWPSIGGILGLWAGVSVITMIEVVSLVAGLIKVIFMYGTVKKTKVDPFK